MDNPPITYKAYPNVTPESELATLANIYAFILDCHAKKKAAEGSGGDDDGKGADHVPATDTIPR